MRRFYILRGLAKWFRLSIKFYKVMMIDLNSNEATCTELAELLKIKDRRVQQLVKEGVLAKHRRGVYPIVENIHRYLDYACARTNYDDSTYENELNVQYKKQKVRLTKFQADEQRVKAELAERKVVSVEDIDLYLSNLFSLMRDKLLNIPERVESELVGETDTVIFSKKLTSEIKDAIYEVCEGADETMARIEELSNE
jgi:phage terminase Nu1 subunit (DNA packaging protein)